MYYPSGLYRLKARAALKGHWQTALLIALIVNLPTLLMQAVSIFTGNDILERLQAVVITASRDGVMSRELLMDEMNVFLRSSGFWTVRGLELAALLVTPCLSLGLYHWLMERLRGAADTDGVKAAFSRARLFLKAVGLQILVILKVLVWMLPGIAGAVALMLPVMRATTSGEQLAALRQSYGMTLPVSMLMIVPGVMAALRYALSEYILADEPETGVLGCIRRSKELMRDQKRNLFMLLIGFLLWYLLETLIASMLAGVLSLVFQMLASLALSVYVSASVSAFYLRLTSGEKEGTEAGGEPAPEELN